VSIAARCNKIKDWIVEWLRGRKQRVCFRGTMSDWLEVLIGVPQGSVLGPLLLLIFINDLDCGISNWILKFADDTKIFGSITSEKDIVSLQKDLDRWIQWADEWQMMFDTSKCKVMHFGKKELNNADYYMSDQCLLPNHSNRRNGPWCSH